MKVTISSFGTTPDGVRIDEYRMEADSGLEARIITYGATLAAVRMPDRDGNVGDITLGFDSIGGYLSDHPYFGATVGRFANRIAHGSFSLGGKTYSVAANEDPHHLHGGVKGFDKRVWGAESGETEGNVFVKLSRISPDGEEGYPGTLNVDVTYCMTSNNELIVDYRAVSDADTPINLTNHSYWNLAGPGTRIDGHHVALHADEYLPVAEDLIPTGARSPVRGTPFDFTNATPLGPPLAETGGFDHCFVIRDTGDRLKPAATVAHPGTGRKLEMWATQPGIQFYTGNFLDGREGREGIPYAQHTAFCLETENFPDAVNNPDFPDAILHAGESYSETAIHRFTWEG